MADLDQESLIDRLRPSLSAERLGTYLTAAGFDEDRALKLYIWNAYIGEAFHLPIQAVEVGLRNRVNSALCATFGVDWWQEHRFRRLADREHIRDLDTAAQRLAKRGVALATPQMVATLSFGFWVGALDARYNPEIWSRQLRSSFPDFSPAKSRYDLADAAKRVANLRNRIWHHEPIFRMDLSAEYAAVMEMLAWICSSKVAWIRPQCRVPAVLREKP
ncbi:MAG: hypothetical protein ACRD5L_01760 [Bryobacteraceae bacterium]